MAFSFTIFDPYLERVIALPNKKWCYFHGVTPAPLLEEFEPETAELCRKSMTQFSLLKAFDRLYANSNYTAVYLSQFIDDKKIEVYPPLFPTRRFAQSIYFDDDICRNDFLVVGRIVPHKQIEDALTVFAEIKKLYPDACLKIIGDAPNQRYNFYLQECVQRLDLSEAVSWCGKVSEDELYDYYVNAVGVINASKHEGFGIPVLEAMFFGLVPIVKTGNAMEEVVEKYGVLFDDALHISISDLSLKKDLRLEMHEYAKRKAEHSLQLVSDLSKQVKIV